MSLSRAAKRVPAAVFAVVMLLCQSLALANACLSAEASAEGASPPCHDSGDSTKNFGQDHCHQASPASAVSIDLPAVTDLPPLAIKVVFAVAEARSVASAPPQLCFEPPPLRLVLCCLRN
jgi:hypothetical protein